MKTVADQVRDALREVAMRSACPVERHDALKLADTLTDSGARRLRGLIR